MFRFKMLWIPLFYCLVEQNFVKNKLAVKNLAVHFDVLSAVHSLKVQSQEIKIKHSSLIRIPFLESQSSDSKSEA